MFIPSLISRWFPQKEKEKNSIVCYFVQIYDYTYYVFSPSLTTSSLFPSLPPSFQELFPLDHHSIDRKHPRAPEISDIVLLVIPPTSVYVYAPT